MKSSVFMLYVIVIEFLVLCFFAYTCIDKNHLIDKMQLECSNQICYNKHLLFSFDKLMLSTSINKKNYHCRIAIKLNDYACSYCNKTVLNALSKKISLDSVLVVLNRNSTTFVDSLLLLNCNYVVDTVNFNFKSIEPVVFLAIDNNGYAYPYSPDLLKYPDVFDKHVDKLKKLASR